MARMRRDPLRIVAAALHGDESARLRRSRASDAPTLPGPHGSCYSSRLVLPETPARGASMIDFGPSPKPRSPIRVLVAVGEAGSGEEAVVRAKATRPDVVLMDLAMPGEGGLEATRQIAALGLGTKILVLTALAQER